MSRGQGCNALHRAWDQILLLTARLLVGLWALVCVLLGALASWCVAYIIEHYTGEDSPVAELIGWAGGLGIAVYVLKGVWETFIEPTQEPLEDAGRGDDKADHRRDTSDQSAH